MRLPPHIPAAKFGKTKAWKLLEDVSKRECELAKLIRSMSGDRRFEGGLKEKAGTSDTVE